MISESQQEQAALYALGMLDADEATAFERAAFEHPELGDLARELRNAAAALVRATDATDLTPPAGVRERVLERVASEARPATHSVVPPEIAPLTSRVEEKIVRPRFGWVPWAIAALFLGCASLLALDRVDLARQLTEVRRLAGIPSPAATDVLSKVAFCELEPTPDAPVKPRAAVLWDAAQHKGVLRVTQLAPPADGKDYQLWAVEAARKEPVNAGVVHVDAEGRAEVPFQPEAIPGDNKVVALAISLEQAGGSPTNQGPILFLGKF